LDGETASDCLWAKNGIEKALPQHLLTVTEAGGMSPGLETLFVVAEVRVSI